MDGNERKGWRKSNTVEDLPHKRVSFGVGRKAWVGVCPLPAAAFYDLGFNPRQGEMLFLLLRLPGAAAHSLEQRENGWRNYPYFGNAVHLEDDPGPILHSIEGYINNNK